MEFWFGKNGKWLTFGKMNEEEQNKLDSVFFEELKLHL